MSDAFGVDLAQLEDSYRSQYRDGAFQLFYDDSTDSTIKAIIEGDWAETTYVEFDSLQFSSSGSDPVYFRKVGDPFDGYVPVIIHMPSKKLLIFGYSSGLGG
ncbi:hypothetical protein [Rubritalea sp.]|uniref:hypothetical protein n=1 Tax=Rubritalea sp. TaxID=2109375 RepID=UPI003EF2E3A9